MGAVYAVFAIVVFVAAAYVGAVERARVRQAALPIEAATESEPLPEPAVCSPVMPSMAVQTPEAESEPGTLQEEPEAVAAMAPAYTESFFDDERLEREKSRARHEETLAWVFEDPDAGAEAKNRAQQALLDAAENTRLEELAESMLRTWGLDDAMVVVGEQGVSVAVKSGRLDRAGAAAIGDIVHRATGVGLTRITIVEKER